MIQKVKVKTKESLMDSSVKFAQRFVMIEPS